MRDSLMLLSSFMKNPKEVGAVAPSSRYLTKEIVKHIDFESSKNIVELGPGLGTFTKVILKKAKPGARLFCFEINKKLCGYLKKTIDDKKLVIINAGAEELGSHLKKLKISKVDCIVSGLPFRNFPIAKKSKIIKEVKNLLSDKGKFILFQYTNELSSILKSHFSKVYRKFVALNMPPAFVYICEKL